MNVFKVKTLKAKFRGAVDNFLGLQLFRAGVHGHSYCHDIKKAGLDVSVIFDVGANIGQSVIRFSNAFPQAQIYCFEPVSKTFQILKNNVNGYGNVKCYNCALGDADKKATIYLSPSSILSSLIKPSAKTDSEEVTVRTVDRVSAENKIEHIDLLKIDAEVFDLEVLKGAQSFLKSHRVSYVVVEVGFQRSDPRHVLFDEIMAYLYSMGYQVYGVYDQSHDSSGGTPLLFANVCFSSAQINLA